VADQKIGVPRKRRDLLRDGEIVDLAAGASAGAGRAEIAARHVGVSAGAEEEGVFAGLEIGIQCDFVNADACVLRSKRNLLFFFDSGFAAGYAAKTSDLKFPVIAFLLQGEQNVVRSGVAVRNIEIENGTTVLDEIMALTTASETFASFSDFRASTEVSKLRPSEPEILRILAMMTSSDRPSDVMEMMS
jgi:hypothetical protein